MISVCMATYNGDAFIKEQVDSILKQLDNTDELIVSDDLSKDNTIKILMSYQDDRIKIFYHKENHGFTQNFENALKHANGDIIILADQDDVWLDGKVETIKKELETVDFIVHDCITTDGELKPISQSRFKDFNIKGGFWHSFFRCRYLGCCMAFNRKLLDVLIPFPDPDMCEHDRWIAFVAEKYFTSKVLYIPLIYYRRHGNNVSSGAFSKGYPFITKIKRRLYWLKVLKERKKLLNKK